MRKTGRTTRLVDFMVQAIFTKGEIVICTNHKNSFDHLMDIFSRRVYYEHNLEMTEFRIENIKNCNIHPDKFLEHQSDFSGMGMGVYKKITYKNFKK